MRLGRLRRSQRLPSSFITRARMAVRKAEHGAGYTPPGYTGASPTCPSLCADRVEQLAAEQVADGCGGGNYCTNNPNIRGQMAAFLVKIFTLNLYGP